MHRQKASSMLHNDCIRSPCDPIGLIIWTARPPYWTFRRPNRPQLGSGTAVAPGRPPFRPPVAVFARVHGHLMGPRQRANALGAGWAGYGSGPCGRRPAAWPLRRTMPPLGIRGFSRAVENQERKTPVAAEAAATGVSARPARLPMRRVSRSPVLGRRMVFHLGGCRGGLATGSRCG